jgi:regulator of extracellular matrix RemA (YlzA/DUF370 family)
MKSLRVGEDFYLNADSVEIVQRFGTRPAEREIARAKASGTLYNATRGAVARTVLTLKSGWVVVSSATPDTLVSRPLIHPPTRPSVRAGAASGDNDDFFGGFDAADNPK